MKILFIPHPIGSYSHLIPLLRLNSMLSENVQSSFYLSSAVKKSYEIYLKDKFNIDILEVENNYSLSSEMKAYALFKPDIIVDDTSLVTGYIRQLRKIPRVTILRTGMFPNMPQKNSCHLHSMGHTINELPDVSAYGFEPYISFTDFLNAESRIIPGIKTIEITDKVLRTDKHTYYSGPLILDGSDYIPHDKVTVFTEQNSDKPLVYITYGMTQHSDTPNEIVECIKYLLDNGAAVITNITNSRDKFMSQYPKSYFSDNFLPMEYLCSKADITFHHCGSGAYHYPILAGKFSITLGTMKYDRDDVAVRLENIGVSKHLPSPEEESNFIKIFIEYFHKYVLNKEHENESVRTKISKLRTEILTTQKEFDFMKVLNSIAS